MKKQIIQDLYDDVIDSSQRYYIAVGRSEDWDSADTPPNPSVTYKEIRNSRLAMQSIKSAEDISFVVPRNNWATGTIYSAWDDGVAGYPASAYYVITGLNTVYICLQRGRNSSGAAVASTVEPTGTSTEAFTTSDGYVWKFLYTITALNFTKFATANYIPVRFIESIDSSAGSLDIEQKGIQDAATTGQISSINVTANGNGYTSAPSVTIVGNGTGASATATISSGSVVKIEMDNDSSAMGSGYTYANVVLTGGGFSTVAEATPIIAPPGGFGADPRNDLKSTAIMFNSKPAGEEGGAWIVDQDFRQVMLLKNVLDSADAAFTAASGNALKSLHFSSIGSAFTTDKIIEGVTSGAQAYVDKYDAGNSRIYYHQTEATGFASFLLRS